MAQPFRGYDSQGQQGNVKANTLTAGVETEEPDASANAVIPLGGRIKKSKQKKTKVRETASLQLCHTAAKLERATPLPSTQEGKQLQGRQRPTCPTATQGVLPNPPPATAYGRYASRSNAVLGCPPTGTPGRLPVCSVARHTGSGVSGGLPYTN